MNNLGNHIKDKILKCKDCQKEFTFSAGEQAYFLSKLLSQPKRCPECRKQRRARLVPEQGVHNA